jgi:hypothetical protein
LYGSELAGEEGVERTFGSKMKSQEVGKTGIMNSFIVSRLTSLQILLD